MHRIAVQDLLSRVDEFRPPYCVSHRIALHIPRMQKTLDCSNCASRAIGFFCDLPKAEQDMCNLHKTTNTYKAGQVLFYEGNAAFGLYCVYSGRIKLYKTGAEGRLQIVRLAGAGDLLGYRSLLADEPYAGTAEAMEDSVVCFIDRRAFLGIVRNNPDLSMRMIKKLAEELRQAEDRMTAIAQKPVKERLVELLLLLYHTYGKPSPKGDQLGIELSREEMAEMIGTTQETVIRLLSDLKAQKLIHLDGRKITFPALAPLYEIANIENPAAIEIA